MALSASATVRTAIDLKNAIDSAAEHLPPIGFCPTLCDEWKVEQYGQEMDLDEELEKADDKKKANEYKKAIEELGDIKREHNSPCFVGSLSTPFSLTITRPMCEFTGEIVPTNDTERDQSPEDKAQKEKDKAADKLAKAELLKKWFEGGAISGYGDVQAQETKVDPSVRNAREITAAEFTVAPELLDSIRKHWADHFFPTLVRVEPYKIHLYGPGGKFNEHRDTPETDLVGSFLVGIGDTTSDYSGGLIVKGLDGWQSSKAHPGTWVAFYPDVKHEVREVRDGYRAVIAFKIFRLPGKVEDPIESVAHAKIKAVLDKMPGKYGLLLERQYCKGTTQLSGFDAQLLAAAKTRTDVETYILPVLTKFDGLREESDEGGSMDTFSAQVFPLMEPHIDALVKFNADKSSDEEDEAPRQKNFKERLKLSLKGMEAAWIEECKVSKVPFYSTDLYNNVITWRRIQQEGAEHTGNESRPFTEDSIYLSYAMVVMRKTRDQKRKREPDEETGHD